MVRARL